MDRGYPEGLSLDRVPSPSFVVFEGALRRNLEILGSVKARTGCKILLALKGFAMHRTFPLIREVLDGVCASSPWEARLGREEFGREVHSFAPAFTEADIEELCTLTDHLVFNSFAQWERFGKRVLGAERRVSCGLRINPEYSEVEVDLYNPCAVNSRLGIRRAEFEGRDLAGIEGLHFHTMCEQGADVLQRTLAVVEDKFSEFFGGLRWVNFGGGHHITRPGYDQRLLCSVLQGFMARHPHLEVYLEPGEAIALNTGILVTTVLDIVPGPLPVAILDCSASAHMPDVLEMPYRPELVGGLEPGALPHTYRLGGMTCLAGDVVGDWSFAEPLEIGRRLIFKDMAHYTMVKTTMFNGVRHPAIVMYHEDVDEVEVVRTFGYEDYKGRLS